jgi:hypothetical protein
VRGVSASWVEEPTRAERPRNSIQRGTHGWQSFIGRDVLRTRVRQPAPAPRPAPALGEGAPKRVTKLQAQLRVEVLKLCRHACADDFDGRRNHGRRAIIFSCSARRRVMQSSVRGVRSSQSGIVLPWIPGRRKVRLAEDRPSPQAPPLRVNAPAGRGANFATGRGLPCPSAGAGTVTMCDQRSKCGAFATFRDRSSRTNPMLRTVTDRQPVRPDAALCLGGHEASCGRFDWSLGLCISSTRLGVGDIATLFAI